MTKLFLLAPAMALLAATSAKAQSLQNQHKTIIWVRTWEYCADGFTPWTFPFYDSLAAVDNTTNFPAYGIHYEAAWTPGIDLTNNAAPIYGNWPSMAIENTGVGIIADACTQTQAVDSLRKLAKQYTTAPAAISLGYTKTMVTSDSVQIKVRSRFNTNATGLYSATVFMVEDGARAWQAQMVSTGNDTVAHRNMLRGTIGYLWGQMLSATDSVFHAGDEFITNFSYKLPAAWNAANLRYVVAIYKWDQATGMKKLINVTDGKFVTTSVAELAHNDITDNMTMFPVPASNEVNVVLNGSEPMENAAIALYDVMSHKVADLYNGTVLPGTPLKLSLPQGIAAGNYMLQLYTEKASAVKQLVIR